MILNFLAEKVLEPSQVLLSRSAPLSVEEQEWRPTTGREHRARARGCSPRRQRTEDGEGDAPARRTSSSSTSRTRSPREEKPKAPHHGLGLPEGPAPQQPRAAVGADQPAAGPARGGRPGGGHAGRPGGIMLPKARGRADVELLDHYLTALEAAVRHRAGLDQGDRSGHRTRRGHVYHRRLCRRAAAGRDDLGRRGPRRRAGREREPQRGRQLRLHLRAGAQPLPPRRVDGRRGRRSKRSRAISATSKGLRKRAEQRPPRRLPRHAGDPPGPGRGDQRGLHPSAEEVARRRRSSICSPPIRRRRDRLTRAACSIGRYLARAQALLALAARR